MNKLQERIHYKIQQHGSIRAAAKVLGVDHAYLWKLREGTKNNPSENLLRKLGLRRFVEVKYEVR